MKLAGLQQYRITYWMGGSKYCYRMGTNHIDEYRQQLKKQYERFIIEEV